MSYLVLARKFRPQNFANVAGQEHIRKVLRNSLRRDRVAHAYLFAGPRGVGKTSLARIFAKSLNCQSLMEGEPCLKCSNCIEIAQGVSLAVREIDGASHNSVENVRELIENFRSVPAPGSRFKVYIIDEVHMLSTSAFNALLKSLEEPPPHTVFILATTEVHKIPETVISRCQLHDFRALDLITIARSLDEIIASEGRQADPGVTQLIARYSEGSMRDSQSLLERVIAYSDDDSLVTVEAARQVLGVAGPAQIEKIWSAIRSENSALALESLTEVFQSGVDTTRFLKEFVESIRAEFAKVACSPTKDVGELIELEQLLSLATRGADSALRSLFCEAALESLVVRLALRKLRDRSGSSGITPKQTNSASAGGGVAAGGEVSSARTVNASSAKVAAPVLGFSPTSEVSSAASMPAPSKNPEIKTTLSWDAFLASESLASQRILVEQLKRLEIEKFGDQQLRAVGPDFPIDYLLKPEVSAKLQQELVKFAPQSNSPRWTLSFQKQTGVTNSVYQREQTASREQMAQRQKSALDHPSVKSLQRAFPGSNVEKVAHRK